MMPNIRLEQASQILAEGMPVPSVGPFELTEAEFIGLEFMRQDDERQLRKTTLRATWSGRELRVKAGDQSTLESDCTSDIYSRILPY